MSRKSRVAVYAVMVLAGLIIILIAGFSLFAGARTPKVEGIFICPGLKARVAVTRDNWGVPHITAQNAGDAYFALGYSVAQDRLFQIELQRRLARGELAEILGPDLVKVDRMFRTYLFRHTAEKYLSRPDKIDPAALACLDSFLGGINHFIATQKPQVEFALLGVTPRPFTRLDVVSMLGYMSFSFTAALDTDPVYTMLKKKIRDRNVDELFPGYRTEKPVTIMEYPASYDKNARARADAGTGAADISRFSQAVRLFGSTFRAPQTPSEIMSFAQRICPQLPGSNSWSIAPSRSASGKAILANDPHVAHSHPGVWYEAHLKYPGHDMYGFHLPIYPFPMMGHSPSIAVGLTMFENDDLDLYEETFNPQNPGEVMYRGKWVKVETLKEAVKVKGGPDEALEIRITPHGPVITDFLEGYEGKPVSMWWVYHQVENRIIDATFRMANAATMEEFRRAVKLIACPGLNFQYADSAGNIAWWAAAKLPIRPVHVNPKEILDGASGRDEVLGYIPFEQNPQMVNPPCGIIVTANNMSTTRPLGPIREVKGYFLAIDRAARIVEILSSREKWSLEELQKVQTDVYSYAAPGIIAAVKDAFGKDPALMKGFSDLERRAWDMLTAWDYLSTVDSTGASVYHALTYHITKEGIGDEMGEAYFKKYLDTYDFWIFLKSFVRDDASAWWDDIRTKDRETRSVVIARAFRETVKELTGLCGSDVTKWRWGSLHRIEYVHPVGMAKPMNLIFNLGPFPAPGDENIVNNMGHDYANHVYDTITVIPSNRRLIDFGNLEKSYCILPAGNSGNYKSPHYDDQVKMYLEGKYRVMNFTDAQVKMNAEHVMELLPAQ